MISTICTHIYFYLTTCYPSSFCYHFGRFWGYLGPRQSLAVPRQRIPLPRQSSAVPRPDHGRTTLQQWSVPVFFVLKWFGQTCSLNCRKAHIHFGSLVFGFEFYNKCYKFSIWTWNPITNVINHKNMLFVSNKCHKLSLWSGIFWHML